MNKIVRNAINISRFVERTERILDREKDEKRRDQFQRILEQTIERMEKCRTGNDAS